jgi:glycosyltransferase involved in cell wall biosynthesis
MRVAVIVRSLKIGGMERVAVSLSEAFADAGHESHLIYFKDKNRVFTPKKSVHFHHFNLDKLLRLTIVGAILGVFAKLLSGIFRGSFFLYNGILLTPIFKYKLKKLEKEYGKFDLIIMRGHGTFELIWPYKDDRVVQMVESVFIRHESSLDKLYIKCVYGGKNLAGVSSGVRDKILEVLKSTSVVAKSVEIVNNPIDIDAIRKKANEYIPDMKESYIVSVGRITPNKNISFLLESYKYARDAFNLTLPLIVIGDGPDMNNIKIKIEELELSSSVKLLGLLTNPFPWVANAKLFTLTSKAEGLPTVVIESLANETKIVSTKSQGGVKDIMKNELKNYLVGFSVEDFAKKMVDTIEEEKKLDFDKYVQSYSPDFIVDSYITKYIKEET